MEAIGKDSSSLIDEEDGIERVWLISDEDGVEMEGLEEWTWELIPTSCSSTAFCLPLTLWSDPELWNRGLNWVAVKDEAEIRVDWLEEVEEEVEEAAIGWFEIEGDAAVADDDELNLLFLILLEWKLGEEVDDKIGQRKERWRCSDGFNLKIELLAFRCIPWI